ncbi:MAG TPA: response regulator [Acidimicrobiales bacterium]|nr:response regulator [Acidimicrobiales bacterium]
MTPVSDVTQETRTEPALVSVHPYPTSAAQAQRASDRILLVEDNPVVQQVTIAMLDHLGFCTDVVDNGIEAVIAATMVPYRAILMDCQIPVLNGYEATMEIRRQWGASRGSPIIAVSASSSEPDRKRCLAAGMDGHLAKPLTLETLAAGMARWSPEPADPVAAPDPVPPVPVSHDATPPTDSERPDSGGPDSGGPALDARVVGRLRRLGAVSGEDLLGHLATVFLADADVRIAALHEAIAHEDGPALIHTAHTLCGAAANLGAADLARLCAHLATDGAVSDRQSGEALLRSVEVELGRVRRALADPTPLPCRSPDEVPPHLMIVPSPDPSPAATLTPLP